MVDNANLLFKKLQMVALFAISGSWNVTIAMQRIYHLQPEASSSKTKTPTEELFAAASTGKRDVIDRLIDGGCDINAAHPLITYAKITALNIALRAKKYDLVPHLMSKGARPTLDDFQRAVYDKAPEETINQLFDLIPCEEIKKQRASLFFWAICNTAPFSTLTSLLRQVESNKQEEAPEQLITKETDVSPALEALKSYTPDQAKTLAVYIKTPVRKHRSFFEIFGLRQKSRTATMEAQ